MAMTTVETTTDQAEPALEIDLPPGFTGLPLHGSEDENAAAIGELATLLAPHAGDQATELPAYLTWFAQMLAANKVRLYGRFAVSDDALDSPVLADLVLAVAKLDPGDHDATLLRGNRTLTATHLRHQYVSRHPEADARIIDLRLGPAMAAVTAGEYRLPPEATRSSQEVTLPRLRAEFHIPAPDGTHLVMMSIATSSEAGRQAVLTEAVRIANSIRLEEPSADAVRSTLS